MAKNAVVLISLFSYSFLIYLPLSKKENDLNIDNLCFFYEDSQSLYNDKIYLKGCNKGFKCEYFDEIGICLEYKPSFKNYNEKCDKDSECIRGLKCIENFCLVEEDEEPYHIEIYDFCSNNTIPIKYEDNPSPRINLCKKKSDHQDIIDKCFISTPRKKSTSPDYMKVCGKINIENNKIESISTSDFGKIDDGNFVEDEKACKSGFALYFYINGNTYGTTDMDTGKICVNVKGVEIGDKLDDCIIRYTKGTEEEFIYNKDDDDMDEDLYSLNDFGQCNLIMTKIDLFQDYLKKFEKLKNHCEQGKFYHEPFTCENDELRKLWFYYNNPDLYLLYKNEEEIINFFIQSEYPTPKYKLEENKKNSSGFFNNKYSLLILLLCF